MRGGRLRRRVHDMSSTLLHTAAIARLDDQLRVSRERRRHGRIRASLPLLAGRRRSRGGAARRPFGVLRPAL